MKRRVFNILSAMSLVLGAIVTTYWLIFALIGKHHLGLARELVIFELSTRWGEFYVPPPMDGAVVVIPFWVPALAFCILPLIWIARFNRPKRPGYCAKCGYDLRATPERCPECGAVPAGAGK